MFRTLSKSKIGFILAILFGISLLFFKSGSRYSNLFNSDAVVATVSGTPITNTKFIRTMEMNINNFKQILGKELDGDEIRSFNIHNLALNALISNAVFENEYDKINFKLDEKVIAQKTKERIPQLYDTNNKLNELYLKSFLNQQKLKIEDIVQIISFETRDNYFKQSFFEVNYPLIFSKKINNYDNHERNISYVNFDINNISIKNLLKGDTADNNIIELEKYYNNNISNYMSEEKRDIEYFVINKNLLKNNFEPSNLEINEYYNNNKELFFENEKRSFIQFNFKDRGEAINFQSETKDLKTSEVLEYASQKNIRFNEFEDLKSDEILENISKSLFNLTINQKSQIIETSLANHILILLSIKKSYQLKLQEVKNEIISTIAKIDSSNFFRDLSNQISEKILSGENISNIANDFNFKIKKINDLTVSFQNTDETNQIIISDLIQKSFTSNKDFVSEVIKINENLSYVYNVLNIKKSEPISLNEIKNQVFKDWKYKKKSEKIKSDVDDNQDELTYFENLAKNYNTELKQLTVSKNSQKIPLGLINKIFKNKVNQNFQYINEDSVYIARVNNVLINNEIDTHKIISLDNDLKASFGEELMHKKKVKLNEALISALIERY